MKTEIRIVAGSLRGRKLTCHVNPAMRPTPVMVREALFSILGDAVPGRTFYDVFAGTGVNGLEALSRGASSAVFVERDFRLVEDIDRHLKAFKLLDSARILRADAYRWAERWTPPGEPVTVFLSPPYPDLEDKPDEMLGLIGAMQEKLAPGSVLVAQMETCPLMEQMPRPEQWDHRKYGRNHLLFWVKPVPPAPELAP
ncbi:MAG: RsmD family RNA methyltransferase [Gemmataceae bacterium]|nr:RsmD family RNA methyltransferase [Gemmataceae bacterium]